MARAGRIAAALMCAILAAAPAATAPPRIVSLSLCSDALLLALLPRDRIASVTFLARDAGSAATRAAAAGVPVNHQSAEEVVRLAPGLVVAGSFAPPSTVALVRRLGIPVLALPQADDFAGIRANIRAIGRAIGEQSRAAALISDMNAALARAAATPLPGPPRVAAWDGSGNLPGRGTLYDAVVTAAGARNVGREAGLKAGGFHVETLLSRRPDFLLHDAPAPAPGREARLSGHPLVRRLWGGRQIAVEQQAFVCGTPESARAALALHEQLRARLPR